jgi:hypothetical protein
MIGLYARPDAPPSPTPARPTKSRKIIKKKKPKAAPTPEPTVEPPSRTPSPPPASEFDLLGLVGAFLKNGENGAKDFLEPDREKTPERELVLATNVPLVGDIHYREDYDFTEERFYRRAPVAPEVVAEVKMLELPKTYKLSAAQRKKMTTTQLVEHEITCLREFNDAISDISEHSGEQEQVLKFLGEFTELISYTSRAKIFPAHLESRTEVIDELVQLRYTIERKIIKAMTQETLAKKYYELNKLDHTSDDTNPPEIEQEIETCLDDLDEKSVFGRLNDGSKTEGGELLKNTIGVHHKGLLETVINLAAQTIEGDPAVVAGLTYRPHTRTYYIRSKYYARKTLKPMDLSPHLQYSMLSLTPC